MWVGPPITSDRGLHRFAIQGFPHFPFSALLTLAFGEVSSWWGNVSGGGDALLIALASMCTWHSMPDMYRSWAAVWSVHAKILLHSATCPGLALHRFS